jgi:broad specificity phosphatase PhoE
MNMNTANEIEILVRARTPLVYIYSSEERRVLETLKRIAVKLTAETTDPRERVNVQLLMWSVVSGLVKWDDDTPVGTP